MSTVYATLDRLYSDRGTAPVIIAEVFTPSAGWLTLRGRPLLVDRLIAGSYRKRVTDSCVRKLRAQGVTHIALDLGNGRTADFTCTELLSRRKSVPQHPH